MNGYTDKVYSDFDLRRVKKNLFNHSLEWEILRAISRADPVAKWVKNVILLEMNDTTSSYSSTRDSKIR